MQRKCTCVKKITVPSVGQCLFGNALGKLVDTVAWPDQCKTSKHSVKRRSAYSIPAAVAEVLRTDTGRLTRSSDGWFGHTRKKMPAKIAHHAGRTSRSGRRRSSTNIFIPGDPKFFHEVLRCDALSKPTRNPLGVIFHFLNSWPDTTAACHIQSVPLCEIQKKDVCAWYAGP